MIITNIIGGLGNQMFQYAAGRIISLGLGVELKLDVSDFRGYHLHQGFELEHIFNASFNIATEADLHEMLGWQKNKQVKKVLRRSFFSFLRSRNLVIEPSLRYWPGSHRVSDNAYLMGYWQSEHYFAKHAATIRNDFTFKPSLSYRNIDIAARINEVNAVSLHVRRGDYVTNLKTNATHGVCSLDYYQSAISYIAERIDQPYFFVFSDDLAWVKNNLKIDFPCQYIDHNHGAESYNDMRLMSMCKHHIIANSSFSWWGAWLGLNSEKIVIAPKRWFANSMTTSDLLPASWTLLG